MTATSAYEYAKSNNLLPCTIIDETATIESNAKSYRHECNKKDKLRRNEFGSRSFYKQLVNYDDSQPTQVIEKGFLELQMEILSIR